MPETSWALVAARAADAKTDEETVVLDVGSVLSIVEFFVITSGRNSRQVRTIAEDVEAKLAEAGGPRPRRVEGLDAKTWVLLDYGDFVVHVFLDETRAYYELERLWADVPRVDWRTGEPAATGVVEGEGGGSDAVVEGDRGSGGPTEDAAAAGPAEE